MFLVAWLATALLLLIAPAVENSGFSHENLAEGLTIASLGGTLVLVVTAFVSLRSQTSITVKMAIALAVMPICMVFLLWIFGSEPNVHGASVGGLLVNGLLGILTGIILLVVVGIRSFIRNNPERQRCQDIQSANKS